jgi:YVTN family beta-propeller protein
MFKGYRTAFSKNWGYLAILLLIMFSFSSYSTADTAQSAQSIAPYPGGDMGAQTLIDEISNRLAAEPYRAELYYNLARAYDMQGWHDKAAHYMNQWIEISNNDTFMKGSHAFVLDEKNDRILVIDKATRKVVRRIDVGWYPKSMIPTPDGDQLYVTNALANTISVVNTNELSVTDTIEAGRMPWNGEASPQGDRIYVTNLKGDSVSVIDIEDNTILETVKVGRAPWGIAISPDGRRLYVSNQNSRDIQVVDTGSYSIVDVISVGTHPRDIALAPDDKSKLYAVDKNVVSDEIEIYVVDLDSPRVLKSLNVPSIETSLLGRYGQMSLEEKLTLLCGDNRPVEKTEKRVPKPRLDSAPTLVAAPPASSQPPRPVTTRDASPEAVELPMGGPAPLAGKPLLQAYVKVPVAPASTPLPSQESEQVDVEHESVATVPKSLPMPEEAPEREEAPGEEAIKQEKQILRIIIVVRHDTLWRLSINNYGVANNDVYKEIQDVNPVIKDPNKIYVGQEIKFPVLNTYKAFEGRSVIVKSKDNLYRIALNNYGRANRRVYAEILKANPRIRDITLIEVGQRIVLPTIPGIPHRHA